MEKKRNPNFKIMVVDDSPLSRKTVVEILEKSGYNVVAQAGSAEDAIRSAHTTPCNLYILDVVMPEMSGIELAKYFSEKFRNSYIMMMSSLNMESIVVESISTGALDFLGKPFEPNDLINAVEKIENEFEKDH